MKQIHARIDLLSAEEIERIHSATLTVLADTGCRLPHKKILHRLQEVGAEVDFATAVVKLPPDLVEKAMASLTVGGRLAAEDRFSKGTWTSVRAFPCNEALIIDYQAGSRRQGTVADVVKGIVLCNELSHIERLMPLVVPTDVPACLADLYGYYLCALYAKKPHGVFILSPESARGIIRMAEIRAAGERPEVSYLLEPNGALSYDDFSLEMATLFAEAGHGFTLAPMAMAGLDAPVTLAGTLVMQNAYNLIGNVIAYLWGVPGCWAGTAHTLDMRSGLCSFGSPNQILIGLAALQIGNWYGFDEVYTNVALTDACSPDFQGGFEKGASAMALLLAGAKLGAQGIVGADQGTSFEQLVIDNEWAMALDHVFSHGLEVNEETLGVQTIKRVGILGNFLADEHTIAHMRQTHSPSTIFYQGSWEAWRARGGKDVYARAHEKVEQILAAHYPPQPVVSAETKAELDTVMEDALAHQEVFQTERYRYAAA